MALPSRICASSCDERNVRNGCGRRSADGHVSEPHDLGHGSEPGRAWDSANTPFDPFEHQSRRLVLVRGGRARADAVERRGGARPQDGQRQLVRDSREPRHRLPDSRVLACRQRRGREVAARAEPPRRTARAARGRPRPIRQRLRRLPAQPTRANALRRGNPARAAARSHGGAPHRARRHRASRRAAGAFRRIARSRPSTRWSASLPRQRWRTPRDRDRRRVGPWLHRDAHGRELARAVRGCGPHRAAAEPAVGVAPRSQTGKPNFGPRAARPPSCCATAATRCCGRG